MDDFSCADLFDSVMEDDSRWLAKRIRAIGAQYAPDFIFSTQVSVNGWSSNTVGMTLLQLAAYEGKPNAARQLLRSGSGVDARARKTALDKDEYPYQVLTSDDTCNEPSDFFYYVHDAARTPLMLALAPCPVMDARAKIAKAAVARMLIAEGASLLSRDTQGHHPLHYALKVWGPCGAVLRCAVFEFEFGPAAV